MSEPKQINAACMARVWFDTEFMEDGQTIELLSIGAVRDDGACFYAESMEADHSKANEWVKKNVLPKLLHGSAKMPRHLIAESFRNFCGERPEIWGYYSDYDWVVLCQLYGRMVDLPKGWPMYCLDVKQLCKSLGSPKLPENGGAHHALADAKWTREAWKFLQGFTSARSESADRSGAPLDVSIKDGALSISIGIDTLAFSMHASPQWPHDERGDNLYRIVDAKLFADDFLGELLREEEDGTTPVHRLFDRMGFTALEQGADGVEEV